MVYLSIKKKTTVNFTVSGVAKYFIYCFSLCHLYMSDGVVPAMENLYSFLLFLFYG